MKEGCMKLLAAGSMSALLILGIIGCFAAGSEGHNIPADASYDMDVPRGLLQARQLQPQACWGGPATCKDTWQPDGMEFTLKLRPYPKPYIFMVALYSFPLLILLYRLLHYLVSVLLQHNGIPLNKGPGDLIQMSALMCIVYAINLTIWVVSAPWAVDWTHLRINIDNQAGCAVFVLAILMSVLYVIDLAARAATFTWLSFLHHLLSWMGVSFMLTLVTNPYELFLGWLYLGNTSLNCIQHASVTAHKLAKFLPDTYKRSLQIARAQLYLTLSHNMLFQSIIIIYFVIHWGHLSPIIKSGQIFGCIFIIMEEAYNLNATCRKLHGAGALDKFGQIVLKVTSPIQSLAHCGARKSTTAAAVTAAAVV